VSRRIGWGHGRSRSIGGNWDDVVTDTVNG
jgi:hypothetical protein